MERKFEIYVCASGGGGNLENLIYYQHKYGFEIIKLITDRQCKAIDIANQHQIKTVILDKKKLGTDFFKQFENEIPINIDLIVLAGFMPILPESLCAKFTKRIINTHPSLLPSYGGKGMYGVHVQRAVLSNKEIYAGCTVHYVSAEVDGGEIILQKKIKIKKNESAWDLGGRIFLQEKKLLPLAIKKIKAERS